MERHMDKALIVTFIIIVAALLITGGVVVKSIREQRSTGEGALTDDAGGKVRIKISPNNGSYDAERVAGEGGG